MESNVESVQCHVGKLALIYMPTDQHRAISIRRRTETNATARGVAVAAFEIRTGNLPTLGHGIDLLRSDAGRMCALTAFGHGTFACASGDSGRRTWRADQFKSRSRWPGAWAACLERRVLRDPRRRRFANMSIPNGMLELHRLHCKKSASHAARHSTRAARLTIRTPRSTDSEFDSREQSSSRSGTRPSGPL